MKKALAILAVLVLLGAAFLEDSKYKIVNLSSSGSDIIAFGDSLTYGVGSQSGEGWVGIVSRDLGIPIVNLGVSGDTTGSALARLSQISGYEPRVVIILLGGNDFIYDVPPDTTFANLEKIIKEVQDMGAAVLLVGVRNGLLVDEHRERFDELAERLGTGYVPDILSGILGKRELMYDTLHPNDAGYRLMADRIAPELEKLLGRSPSS